MYFNVLGFDVKKIEGLEASSEVVTVFTRTKISWGVKAVGVYFQCVFTRCFTFPRNHLLVM